MVIFAWLRRHWATLVLAFIALGTFWALHGTALLNQRAKYTIGYLTGWHYTAKSGRAFNYCFTVAGTVYEGSSTGGWDMDERSGAGFVVK